ncbi:MAG: hypothetical protein LBI31_04980 [Zoogloeaceae bacterium]|jgi:DNA-binding IclR family transcriptional regulator|nr:hypothetical protein [Zoogloeaceae bacterium]
MNAQARLLATVEALAGNEVSGLRLKEVAEALGEAGGGRCVSTVLRDLESLESCGWAEKLPDGKWRLAARPIQLLNHFQSCLARAKERVDEVEANYSRIPSHL